MKTRNQVLQYAYIGLLFIKHTDTNMVDTSTVAPTAIPTPMNNGCSLDPASKSPVWFVIMIDVDDILISSAVTATIRYKVYGIDAPALHPRLWRASCKIIPARLVE